jgi:outer membrane protein TolC
LEVGRRQAANRLCILLGMPVRDLSNELPSASIPVTPAQMAVGIPADLMRRRPDVRRAERAVAAQSAQIGVATSDLYPRLSINGFIGYVADDLSDLFDSRSFTGFVLPTAQWQLLNYGRIVNNIRVQDARLEAAALDYQQTVLTAGREVEDALVQYVAAHRQARSLEAGVAEAQRSVELVLLQFEGGVTDFNRVYNTQTALMQQQDQLASTRGTIALALVEVYRSMGGGWQQFAPAAVQSIASAPPSRRHHVMRSASRFLQ